MQHYMYIYIYTIYKYTIYIWYFMYIYIFHSIFMVYISIWFKYAKIMVIPMVIPFVKTLLSLV